MNNRRHAGMTCCFGGIGGDSIRQKAAAYFVTSLNVIFVLLLSITIESCATTKFELRGGGTNNLGVLVGESFVFIPDGISVDKIAEVDVENKYTLLKFSVNKKIDTCEFEFQSVTGESVSLKTPIVPHSSPTVYPSGIFKLYTIALGEKNGRPVYYETDLNEIMPLTGNTEFIWGLSGLAPPDDYRAVTFLEKGFYPYARFIKMRDGVLALRTAAEVAARAAVATRNDFPFGPIGKRLPPNCVSVGVNKYVNKSSLNEAGKLRPNGAFYYVDEANIVREVATWSGVGGIDENHDILIYYVQSEAKKYTNMGAKRFQTMGDIADGRTEDTVRLSLNSYSIVIELARFDSDSLCLLTTISSRLK